MSHSFFFFFNDTATTEIYTLSLHDALPICCPPKRVKWALMMPLTIGAATVALALPPSTKAHTQICRSEEHTSELQSQSNLVCRLLLEKKKHKSKHMPQREKTPITSCNNPLS